MANEVRVLLFAAVVSAGHPAGSAVAVDESAPLARHAATFTTFCDTGSVSDGSCWCKGGSMPYGFVCAKCMASRMA